MTEDAENVGDGREVDGGHGTSSFAATLQELQPAIQAVNAVPPGFEPEMFRAAGLYEEQMKWLTEDISDTLLGLTESQLADIGKTFELAMHPAFAEIPDLSHLAPAHDLFATLKHPVFQETFKDSLRFQLLPGTSITDQIEDLALTGVLDQARATSKAWEAIGAELVEASSDTLAHSLQDLALPAYSFDLANRAFESTVPDLEPRELEIEPPRPARPEAAQPAPTHRERLEQALENIDPDLADLLRGAWDTAHRRGPDYRRQAAHSMRQLVEDLLYRFAPDDAFTPMEIRTWGPDDDRITKRMRAYKIVSRHGPKKKAQAVGAQAEYVVKFYRWASDVAHQDLDTSIEELILSGEGLVMSLLESKDLL